MRPQDADGSHHAMWREIRSRHPGLREAIGEDARVTALYRLFLLWALVYFLVRRDPELRLNP